MVTRKFVITGPPGSGKTTYVNALKDKGFSVVEENARDIIKKQLAKGSDAVPWKDVQKFSELVLKKRIVSFKQSEGITFFDRSIIDIIAYLWVDDLEVSDQMDDAAKTYRYSKEVFVTQPWEKIYKKDSERKESFEKSLEIYEKIKSCYQHYGYNIILLPKNKIKNVVDFILKKIKSQ